MLSKCANPDCSAAFHYYGEGRLFEVHFEDAGMRENASHAGVDPKAKPIPNVEHFWLCAECSGKLTVALDRQNKVLILPRPKGPVLAPELFRRAAAS